MLGTFPPSLKKYLSILLLYSLIAIKISEIMPVLTLKYEDDSK